MGGVNRADVGKQIHLPFTRAFKISLKSIKIRFWRSLITAAGIFLGIAFLVSVLTQLALQAPPTPVEHVYPKVFVRGMVPNPLDKALEPGLTARAAVEYAGGYKARADKRGVTVITRSGDKVALDYSNPETPDYRLQGGDVVFVPDASGRFRQLMIALVVVVLIVVGLLLVRYIDVKTKRIAASVAIVVGGILIFAVGLARSGLTPPGAPRITVVERYHIRGEVNVPVDVIAGKGRPLSDALSEVSGYSKTADLQHIMVVRRDKKKVTIDITKAEGKEQAKNILLQAGDLVYVPDASSRNRQIWLVVMSLLVCTIGITNSMLMSVTERFKEIGTMKCLGALDKFVVELFLLESSLLGIVASFFGWLVGFGLVAITAGAAQGWGLLLQLTIMDVLRILGIALGAGSLLTTIATIAPAIRAAQMPPAAALRVEI